MCINNRFNIKIRRKLGFCMNSNGCLKVIMLLVYFILVVKIKEVE